MEKCPKELVRACLALVQASFGCCAAEAAGFRLLRRLVSRIRRVGSGIRGPRLEDPEGADVHPVYDFLCKVLERQGFCHGRGGPVNRCNDPWHDHCGVRHRDLGRGRRSNQRL